MTLELLDWLLDITPTSFLKTYSRYYWTVSNVHYTVNSSHVSGRVLALFKIALVALVDVFFQLQKNLKSSVAALNSMRNLTHILSIKVCELILVINSNQVINLKTSILCLL